MLPRKYRLPGYRVPQIVKTGRRVTMPTVSCAISLQDEQGLKISRFAVVVPTRIAKKSVDRNRIKRLIYEVLRLHKEYLTDGFDVLLFANAPIQNQKYEDVEPVVVDLLKKSKLLSSK